MAGLAFIVQEEDGTSRFTLEDGSGSVLEEESGVSLGIYIVQEEDGTSQFTLEEGDGSITQEETGTFSNIVGPVTTPSGPTTPVNTGLPVISGDPEVGGLLTATNGTWTNSPTSFTYQWQQCDPNGLSCTVIVGATAQTYVVQAGDAGLTVRVLVLAAAAASAAASAAVGIEVPNPPPPPPPPPPPSGSDSYNAQLFRDNGRFVDSSYGEILFQERRRRGRRIR